MKKHVPILCIDFDGVIHSYTSGWQGPSQIPDPPMPWAIDWLRSLLSDCDRIYAEAPRFLDFDVCIYSHRSMYWRGRRAMKRWLGRQFEERGYSRELINLIRFPKTKPLAFLQIDDRAMTFTGAFPSVEEMKAFQPRSPLKVKAQKGSWKWALEQLKAGHVVRPSNDVGAIHFRLGKDGRLEWKYDMTVNNMGSWSDGYLSVQDFEGLGWFVEERT